MRKIKLLLLAVITSNLFFAQSLPEVLKYIDNEQYEKASKTVKKLIAGEPNNGDNYFWLGEIYSYKDEPDSALTAYEAGIKKNPSNALCMVGIGKMMWLNGKNQEAKKQFYSAGVVVADKTNKLSAQQKSLVHLKIAEVYIKSPNKDISEAINQINKAAGFDDKNPDVKIMMGDALFEQNPANGSPAITEYKKAMELDKNSPIGYFKIGELYLKAKNPEAAQDQLDLALKKDSMFAPAYRIKAEAYYYRSQLDKALTAYKKYLAINKGNTTARVRYASFLYVAKKYNEAIQEIKSIQSEAPEAYFLLRLLGKSYYELGDVANGLSAMNEFFKKQPKDKLLASDYETMGNLFAKSGNDSLAIENYYKGLKLDSSKADLYSLIGEMYTKQKRYADAAIAYRKKIDNGGKTVTANDYYYLGRAYYYNKDYVNADSAFVGYCNVAPDFYFGYLWRGKCNSLLDPESKTWQAKPYYEASVLKFKENDNKKDQEEAYWYMGYYYFSQKEFANAKCCYLKIQELNTGSDRFKKAVEAINGPELKSITPAETCVKQ